MRSFGELFEPKTRHIGKHSGPKMRLFHEPSETKTRSFRAFQRLALSESLSEFVLFRKALPRGALALHVQALGSSPLL